MIEYYSPSLRKPKKYSYPGATRHSFHQEIGERVSIHEKPHVAVSELPAMLKEAHRKDAIIKDIVKRLDYKMGDVVTPSTEENVQLYGKEIRVVAIVDSYGKFGKACDWPANDNPMIIHAYSFQKKESFICTANWLKPVIPA
jgi:hypothetical protein